MSLMVEAFVTSLVTRIKCWCLHFCKPQMCLHLYSMCDRLTTTLMFVQYVILHSHYMFMTSHSCLFFSISMWRFFLTWIEGLRTEDVVHCADCKAHWGNVIVILGYINKIDLIWGGGDCGQVTYFCFLTKSPKSSCRLVLLNKCWNRRLRDWK